MAYLPVTQPRPRGKGRPRVYGQKVRLKELADDESAFASAPSSVYDQNNVTVRYRVLDLVWCAVGCMIRFVIVHHP